MQDLNLVRRYCYLIYLLKSNISKYERIIVQKELDFIIDNYDINDNHLKEYYKYKQRIKTLKRRITELIAFSSCSFLTLTFNNDCLNKTSFETRKRYVKKFLNSISDYYIANVDYGKENGREHYHVIIEGIDFDFTNWHYGFYKCIKIRNDYMSVVKLTKYINKLSNHAFKETTDKKIIYSRLKKNKGA